MNREEILEKHNIIVVKEIDLHDRSYICIGKLQNKLKFIKLSQNQDKQYTIESQVAFNIFFNSLKDFEAGVVVPKAKLIIEAESIIGVFEYYDLEPFASSPNLKLKSLPNKAQVEHLCVLLQKFDQLNINEMPQQLIKVAKKQEDYLSKFNQVFLPELQKIISTEEIGILKDILENSNFEYRLQHNDFCLWNMLDKQNEVVLVDAEHSRLGIRWYDVAYYILQTYISLGVLKHAQEFLKTYIDDYVDNIDWFKKQILIPFAYRLSAKIVEFKDDNERLERCKKLLEIIKTKDIENFYYIK